MHKTFIHIGLRHLGLFLALGCFMVLSTMISGPAYAKSVPPSTSTNNCTVTSITLHGKQAATVTSKATPCTKQTPSTAAINPLLSAGGCDGSEQLFMEDTSYNYYCFYGTGYLGYRINNVYYAENYGYPAWVRIYPNGSTNGCFYNMAAGTYTYFASNQYITQVAVNGTQHSNLC